MSWFSKTKERPLKHIEWKKATSIEDVDLYNDLSFKTTVVFFKHSTRCSISSMAKSRFERTWEYSTEEIVPVYVDLLEYRNVSNDLARRYGIDHQSPQILVIRNGKCVHSTTHGAIDPQELAEFI
ncbi:MAG: bacillithiol system redox-active protein YtxJ [Flavobacteriales bacterium]|nr:bacillithiol system redox-active protein YtxJ [Flavobacteriales bacterium]MCB9198101.1 bacillithiol system redox-active protein YtxJ [Flavobacteriales bacterium]